MDTSPEYIKMCERAEEIQNDWILHKGDYYYHKLNNKISFVSGWFEARTAENAVLMTHYHGRLIWLPRLDQLIEMLHCMEAKDPFKVHLTLAIIDAVYGLREEQKENYPFTSTEQAFLDCVMENRFNKRWSGENWQENEG